MSYRVLSCCLLAVVVAAPALAGQLAPPAGPVTSTGRFGPRIELNQTNTPGTFPFLYSITKPGSYYLSGNVSRGFLLSGIKIASSGVTLDLMGFELSGGLNSGSGISVTAAVTSVRIYNGTVRFWGGAGVAAINASNSSLRDLFVEGNGGIGIGIGPGSLVENCAVDSNTGFGIDVGDNSTVTGCTARNTTGTGIRTGSNVIVRGCAVESNTSNGIEGMAGSAIEACAAQNNGLTGIVGGQSAIIIGCTSRRNSSDGFRAGSGSTISQCSAYANTGDGFSASSSTMISECSAAFSGVDGIAVGTDAVITSCSAYASTNDGIQVSGRSLVMNNHSYLSGNGGDGAGIHVFGSNSRIDGNSVVFGDRGFDVERDGNLIVRNSVRGGGIDYVIVVGNAVAPIVRAATNPVLISGNSYAGPLGTTDPWANFSY